MTIAQASHCHRLINEPDGDLILSLCIGVQEKHWSNKHTVDTMHKPWFDLTFLLYSSYALKSMVKWTHCKHVSSNICTLQHLTNCECVQTWIKPLTIIPRVLHLTATYACPSYQGYMHRIPDSKVHGANMGPIWDRQNPGESHVGPMNLAIWDIISMT